MNEDQVHRREPLLSVNKEPDASLFLCVDEGTEEEGLLRITPIGAPISPRRFKLLEEVGDEGAYVIGCPRILALVEVDPLGSAFEELLQGECFARDLRTYHRCLAHRTPVSSHSVVPGTLRTVTLGNLRRQRKRYV